MIFKELAVTGSKLQFLQYTQFFGSSGINRAIIYF